MVPSRKGASSPGSRNGGQKARHLKRGLESAIAALLVLLRHVGEHEQKVGTWKGLESTGHAAGNGWVKEAISRDFLCARRSGTNTPTSGAGVTY
ncbi:hypothetical protein TIFTF001_009577 [Ficus carica]|uniref:Uncharacterized protein n=1 Tax=Ficus carica TaxID=3494 RepID=A0AA88AAM9_FICCA|nr:hypothetical protein TIFTF001_009577 [Ficus carica]